ncbi:hypothetical protein AVEN_262362-1 [Araneus ventricosus]|uniref:Uncharacterized protein n=1 Tax=Araneus ventricosus TaxID=182803 RepID=A0A4Y2M2B4_ARAVE|nr:hypothetical protein AVEN_262362-1 [Araneus ventricosus]
MTEFSGLFTYGPILVPLVGLGDVTFSAVKQRERQRGSGSASRCSGGRDEPPRPDAASVAPRRWVPPSSIKRDAISPQEKNDQVFRRVRGILNKLTPEKFHKLSEELLSVGLDSTQILKGVILLMEKQIAQVQGTYAQALIVKMVPSYGGERRIEECGYNTLGQYHAIGELGKRASAGGLSCTSGVQTHLGPSLPRGTAS